MDIGSDASRSSESANGKRGELMVMSTTAKLGKKGFGTGIMLAMLLAAFAAFAQDANERIDPAVDTSAVDLEPAVDTSANASEDGGPATGRPVMDSIELSRTEITGNQELPKVLYIVPWKRADPGDLKGKPVNSLLDEVLAPIDREEFLRQVDYYENLYSDKKQE